VPNIGNSSVRGKMIGMGYFWAINRSYDLTYRAQYFSEVGFAHNVDLRENKPEDRFRFWVYALKDTRSVTPSDSGRPDHASYQVRPGPGVAGARRAKLLDILSLPAAVHGIVQ